MKGEKSRYRMLIAVPVVMLLASAGILVYGFMQNGEWFQRSIELKGGTLITIKTDRSVDANAVENALSSYGDVLVRELRSFSGYSLSIEMESGVNTTLVIESLKGIGIDAKDYSVQSIGSSLGESFWQQAQMGIIIAFVLMGLIVFVIFRTFVPSIAVMLAAVSDIIVTLAVMQVAGIEMSLASFAALLMLIGYSIDTDILLTTRVLKSEETSVPERIKSAFRTGMTMTGTTLGAVGAVMLASSSTVLFQITSVLMIGLIADIVNTWFQNATILRMYAERRGT